MERLVFDLGDLLVEQKVLTRDLIAPTIYRLAERRREWQDGQREISVEFRESLAAEGRQLGIVVTWSLAALAQDGEYYWARRDLAKLAHSKNAEQITELAALGIAFLLVKVLLPTDKITKVVPKGGRGDFYLNGRRDHMIEISGTIERDLHRLFNEKKRQILLNPALSRAMVNVSRFATPASRLERVR
jgi:hypothetical protein